MYYFIVNPGSRTGKGHELWETLKERLESSKTEYEVFFTQGAGDATRFAEKICKEHPEMKNIVICGGDGTANEAVNGLSDYGNFILGYVPTGSSNDLARGLGIPDDPVTALMHAISPDNYKYVDHSVVEYLDGSGRSSKRFAVSTGIGYDAEICRQAMVSKFKKFLNLIGAGKLIYLLIGFKLILTCKRTKATITVDGEKKIETNGLLYMSSMNTLYEGGGIPMAGFDTDPSDGKLTLCIVHDISRWQHLLMMPSASKGGHIGKKGVEIITCREVEIETSEPLAIHTDGEVDSDSTHIRVSCMPEQVRMTL